MLDYHDALAELLAQLRPVSSTTELPLLSANHHLLAKNLIAQYDAPLFTNSAMDGYAVAGHCQEWRIVDRLAAGDSPKLTPLKTGEAVRIFTGAPVPQGCTGVIIQEKANIQNHRLTTQDPLVEYQNIRQQGEELSTGDLLLQAQERLTPPLLALLASQGYEKLPVLSPLRITVFSTGNELINPPEPLQAGKIYDANRYLLISWLQQLGHKITDGGILPDSLQQTKQALTQATTNSDVIITSGGVSVGEEDHLKTALDQLGKLVLWKLAIKPGKPFAWGKLEHTKVFMLPGNPVSSLVTFHQLVLPALKILAGEPLNKALPQTILAKAAFNTHKLQSRREFIRVQYYQQDNQYIAQQLPNQGSAMLATFTTANALAEIAPNTSVKEGDFLTLYPLTL